MITHDRYFLDRVSNKILEVNNGQIYQYESNYSGYLESKAQREEMALSSERKRQSLLRKELPVSYTHLTNMLLCQQFNHSG